MLYNKLLEKVVLPIAGILTGDSFMDNLKKIRKYDNFSKDQLNNLQKEKLSNLLEYSVLNSPYYTSLNLEKDSNPITFLKKFPILEKKILLAESNNILTNKEDLITRKSSGSSGFQTTVYLNKKEQSIQRAYQLHWWEWAGYKIGKPILQTGITPKRGFIKKIKDILFKTYYISAFAHDEKSVLDAFKWVKKRKKVFFGGYASSLYVFSKIAIKNNVNINFDGSVSWGDKLFNHYKKEIKLAFNSDVKETYGSSEGFLIAAQKDTPYMYIMNSHIYLEIVDDNGNSVPDGELGHVLVTSLDAYTMPLIRYRIGDLAIILPKEKYPKKRDMNFPLLEKVIGRDTDIIKTRSGKYMVVHSFTGIFEHYKEVEQYCVVQEDLDGILILYIPSEYFKEEVLLIISKQLHSYLNEPSFKIRFSCVTKIEPTKSGKPQIIKSLLKSEK